MAAHLPWRILSMIVADLSRELCEKHRANDLCNLLLVSKGVQGIVEPILYREIHTDGTYIDGGDERKAIDRRSPLLCRTILNRPDLAAYVRKIAIEESQLSFSGEEHFYGDDEEDDDEEDDDEEDDGEDEEPEKRSKKTRFSPSDIEAARGVTKSKFKTEEAREHWLKNLKIDEVDSAVMQGILLCQLPNLVSLTLTIHSGMFGHLVTFLRLPCLEELRFIIDMGSFASWWDDALEGPEDILESILMGTENIRTLQFEDYRNVYFPTTFGASKLKKILDRHVAKTVTDLSIVLSMNEERDWRLPQEYTVIDGAFGSMTDYVRLERLSIQLELLLGKPSQHPHRLPDVLPNQLESLTCLSLAESDDRMYWEREDYTAQFELLAQAAQSEARFPSLTGVKMDVYRKSDFWKYDEHVQTSGRYTEGILGDSGIDFEWH